MANKNIKIGCEIFLIHEGNILLGKRKNCYGEGTWALPGGHLEHGETLLECAKRELKEEVGLEGIELKLITIVDDIDERGHYLHISFLLEKYSGEIQNIEPHLCEGWQFFSINALPHEIFKPHQKILTTYLNNKESKL